jgi:hypothetical protein
MTEQNLKPVTQDEVFNRVLGLSGRIVRTAILAAVVYTAFMPLGLALGAWGGAALASHFALGWASTAGLTVLGVGVGGVAAFFGAKVLVADKVTDLVVGTGLTAGEMGLRSLLRTLRQARAAKQGAAAEQPAHFEKAVEKSHKTVTWLRNFFGETAEAKPPVQKSGAPAAPSSKPPALH